MTVPWLSNCPHSDDAFCLDCAKELGERYEQSQATLRDLTPIIEGLEVAKGGAIATTGRAKAFLLEQGIIRAIKTLQAIQGKQQ